MKDYSVLKDIITLAEACAQATQNQGAVVQFQALAESKEAVRGVPRPLYRAMLEAVDAPTPNNFALFLREAKAWCNATETFSPLDGLRGLETVRPRPPGAMAG